MSINNKNSNFNPPYVLIAGEIKKDVRYKSVFDSGNFTVGSGNVIENGEVFGLQAMPSGKQGYVIADFPSGESPSNLNESGFYEIRTSKVGIWDQSSLQTTMSSISELDQFNVAAVSLDGIFIPYTTGSGDNSNSLLPHFEYSSSDSSDIDSRSLNPFNPLNKLPTMPSGYESGVVGSGYPSGIEGYWLKYGHNIALALSSDFLEESGVEDFNFEEDYYYRGRVETTGIRSMALRGPLVMGGWGYDVDGNPVPSSGSDMHPEAYWNPSIWKVGPVDLRWDDNRKVWTGGNTTKMFLVKVTNLYNPPNFSFEVDRSNSRSQYSRLAPTTKRTFSSTENIYDPEAIAYTANSENVGTYESLDYSSVEFPHYEAFIIRETVDDVGNDYYNIWTEDCQDCGHISNSGCGTQNGMSSLGKKILIENPLKQSLDVGDLAFTVKTGRKKNVNTGIFTGGSGVLGSGNIVTDSSGNATFDVTSGGNGYSFGAFGIVDSGICASVSIFTNGDAITSGTVTPSSNLPHNQTYSVSIYPTNATVETESLDIHWIMQAEFKHQQVITHVEADGGLLQSCSVKIQTQGYKTCEWCGEDTSLINSY